ncbi:MAG: VOC family protein [Marmoricola sp.]|nr:VOC family protein [Marmoricola sp.]
MAAVKRFQVTFDCARPEGLAAFWCEVLGYDVTPGATDAAAACTDPTGVGPRLYFQRVPEGKVVKNRVHLDVRVGTGLVGEERVSALEAEEARLLPLGAQRVQLLLADDENESCLVMQDPEGNEFCLD